MMEDDETMAKELKKMLAEHGHHVGEPMDWTENAEQGLDGYAVVVSLSEVGLKFE